MQLVQPYTLFSGTAADWIAAGSAITLSALLPALLGARRGKNPETYYPALAWLCASAYFCCGLLLSWSLGVMQSLLAAPLVLEAQLQDPLWTAYTLFYLVVLWVGYMMIWPGGTFTDGRARHPLLTTIYGLLWGLCHGQVFLCFWALAEHSGLNSYWVAGISYLLLGGYNFAFHQYFWDIQVSPPHNYLAWNMKKVLYCHTPNLMLGLLWLALWGNFGLWLLLQTACLLASAHNMRFPAWFDDYRGRAGETR